MADSAAPSSLAQSTGLTSKDVKAKQSNRQDQGAAAAATAARLARDRAYAAATARVYHESEPPAAAPAAAARTAEDWTHVPEGEQIARIAAGIVKEENQHRLKKTVWNAWRVGAELGTSPPAAFREPPGMCSRLGHPHSSCTGCMTKRRRMPLQCNSCLY